MGGDWSRADHRRAGGAAAGPFEPALPGGACQINWPCLDGVRPEDACSPPPPPSPPCIAIAVLGRSPVVESCGAFSSFRMASPLLSSSSGVAPHAATNTEVAPSCSSGGDDGDCSMTDQRRPPSLSSCDAGAGARGFCGRSGSGLPSAFLAEGEEDDPSRPGGASCSTSSCRSHPPRSRASSAARGGQFQPNLSDSDAVDRVSSRGRGARSVP